MNSDRITQLRPDPFTPKPDRLDPGDPHFADFMAAHDAALAAGQDGFLDPITGLFVMSAGFLSRRGWCCERGCRHCPYVNRE